MGTVSSTARKYGPFKYKTEEDLPKKERSQVKDLLKHKPELKPTVLNDKFKNPREWIMNKLGYYYCEPFLTNLSTWSDKKLPLNGSFSKDKLNLIRSYVIDQSLVPNPSWDMRYMTEVYQVWDSLSNQYPGNKVSKVNLPFWPTILMSQNVESGIHTAQLSLTHDVEEDDFDFMAAFSDNKTDNTESHRRFWSPCVKPMLIFPKSDSKSHDIRGQCVKTWYIEGQKAIATIADRRRGDNSRIIREQHSFIRELIVVEFKRIFKLIKHQQEPDTDLAPIIPLIVNYWLKCVSQVQTTLGRDIDVTQPIEQNIKDKIVNAISTEMTQKILDILIDKDKSQKQDQAEEDSTRTQLNTNLNAPLVTFDNKVMEKTLSLAEINNIIQFSPDPLQKSSAFLNWYSTLLMHGSFSGKDLRYILTTLMPYIKADILIEACPTLSEDNDGPQDGEVELERKYLWLSRTHKEDHIKELTEFLKLNAAQDRDISQLLTCKRRPTESVSSFAQRFLNTWKNDAKLEIKDNDDPFFVSMFFNSLDPQTTYTIKLSAPEVFTFSPGALLKKIRELESVGVFNKPKIVAPLFTKPDPAPLHADYQNRPVTPRKPRRQPQNTRAMKQHDRYNAQRGRNKWQYSGKGYVNPHSNDQCFSCHEIGHWADECPYKNMYRRNFNSPVIGQPKPFIPQPSTDQRMQINPNGMQQNPVWNS